MDKEEMKKRTKVFALRVIKLASSPSQKFCFHFRQFNTMN
jgi:hypothetical protein